MLQVAPEDEVLITLRVAEVALYRCLGYLVRVRVRVRGRVRVSRGSPALASRVPG